ncbi:MAG: hypothetical protein ABI164_00080 [Acidobacteriaceae bacterium]
MTAKKQAEVAMAQRPPGMRDASAYWFGGGGKLDWGLDFWHDLDSGRKWTDRMLLRCYPLPWDAVCADATSTRRQTAFYMQRTQIVRGRI